MGNVAKCDYSFLQVYLGAVKDSRSLFNCSASSSDIFDHTTISASQEVTEVPSSLAIPYLQNVIGLSIRNVTENIITNCVTNTLKLNILLLMNTFILSLPVASASSFLASPKSPNSASNSNLPAISG